MRCAIRIDMGNDAFEGHCGDELASILEGVCDRVGGMTTEGLLAAAVFKVLDMNGNTVGQVRFDTGSDSAPTTRRGKGSPS